MIDPVTVGTIIGFGAGCAAIIGGGIAVYDTFFKKKPAARDIPEYEMLLNKHEAKLEEHGRDKERLRISLEEVSRLRGELQTSEGRALEVAGLPTEPAKLESAEAKAKRGKIEQRLANVVDHFTQGYEANLREDWFAALEHYEAALDEERTIAVLNNLGVVYDELGRYKDALAAYDTAEALRLEQGLPEDWHLTGNRGAVYWSLGRNDEALAAFDNAEKLRREQGLPEDWSLAKNRGNVYQTTGRYMDALAAFDMAEALRREQGLPEDWQLAGNRGAVYWSLGRNDEALAAFDNAEKLRREQGLPEDWSLAKNRGAVYWSLGRNDEALAAFDTAEALRLEQGLPEDSDLATNRGAVYGSLRRFDEALTEYDKAEKLRREQGLPEDPAITYNRAHLYKAQGDMEIACKLARQARDMYAEHLPQAPVHPNILKFIAEHCPEGAAE